MPIPFTAVRNQERLRLQHWIAAQPSAARLVPGGSGEPIVVTVRISEAPKVRELRLGGFSPTFDIDAQLALPFGVAKPESQKDVIEIQDLDDVYQAYTIAEVTSLRGTGCYRLGLKSRRSAPTRPAPKIRGVNA